MTPARIGDVHVVGPARLYIGASATDEAWARVLDQAIEHGSVRIFLDEDGTPTMPLMQRLTGMAASRGLDASWRLNLPTSVDLTVHVDELAPPQSHGTHGKRVTDVTGAECTPSPVVSPAGPGEGPISPSTQESPA